jgi:AraC-like DNA-binding protein
MSDPLINVVRNYAQAHADSTGIARTPIAGLTIVRATAPTGLNSSICKPLVCLVLQGAKEVVVGDESFTAGGGDSLLITANVLALSRVVRANREQPYLALALELDPALIAELDSQTMHAVASDVAPVRIAPTDADIADTALRLMRLLERPSSLPVLHTSLLREMHYWLMAGPHGAAIRRLSWPGSQVLRVARAVAVLRSEFARPMRVEQLADIAGMSLSSFHHHFREVTSLTPLQFQKRLRLIEARRLMLSQRMTASRAAFTVGYESVSQFTREYTRMYGVPPAKHRRSAEENVVRSKVAASIRQELALLGGSVDRSRHGAAELAAV